MAEDDATTPLKAQPPQPVAASADGAPSQVPPNADPTLSHPSATAPHTAAAAAAAAGGEPRRAIGAPAMSTLAAEGLSPMDVQYYMQQLQTWHERTDLTHGRPHRPPSGGVGRGQGTPGAASQATPAGGPKRGVALQMSAPVGGSGAMRDAASAAAAAAAAEAEARAAEAGAARGFGRLWRARWR